MQSTAEGTGRATSGILRNLKRTDSLVQRFPNYVRQNIDVPWKKKIEKYRKS